MKQTRVSSPGNRVTHPRKRILQSIRLVPGPANVQQLSRAALRSLRNMTMNSRVRVIYSLVNFAELSRVFSNGFLAVVNVFTN